MAQTDEDRLRAVLDAAIAVSSELSLDAVLQRIVESAASLTGAQYAALGVINPSRQALERFVVTGIDDETRAAIGDLPRGRGILGVLISDATALRIDDLSADPRAIGFPPNHPPMRTFLGVPVLLRGVAYGNLYLTEKAGGGPFTEEDQEIVQLLASPVPRYVGRPADGPAPAPSGELVEEVRIRAAWASSATGTSPSRRIATRT